MIGLKILIVHIQIMQMFWTSIEIYNAKRRRITELLLSNVSLNIF